MEEIKEEIAVREETDAARATVEGGEPSRENDCGNEPADEHESADIGTLLAEAEHRGYMRGRNERIEQLMEEPGMLERNSDSERCEGEEEKVEILRHRRISIWDL